MQSRIFGLGLLACLCALFAWCVVLLLARQLAVCWNDARKSSTLRVFRRAWRGSAMKSLSLTATFAALRASQVAEEVLPDRWFCVSGYEDLDSPCLPSADPRRIEPLTEWLFLGLAAQMILHLNRASSSVHSVRRGLGFLTHVLVFATSIMIISVLVVPDSWLDGSLMLYVHSVFASLGILFACLTVFVHFQVRSASLAVPIHNSILSKVLRRLLGMSILVTIGLLSFGAYQLWISVCNYPSSRAAPYASVRFVAYFVAQFVPCSAIVVFNSGKILFRGQEGNRRLFLIPEAPLDLEPSDLNMSLLSEHEA